jgi:AcrR family transcriptional regulator
MLIMEKKESAKDRILHVASELFYQEGIRAVGIDRIIAESAVAKASFYRNFATKDDLVVAFVEQRHAISMARFTDAKSRYPNLPKEQLHYIFSRMAVRMKQPDFRGCPFMNTIVEFPSPQHPGHLAAVASRDESWTQVTQIVKEAGAKDPDGLSAQLAILYYGALIMAYIQKANYDTEPFHNAVILMISSQVPDFEAVHI